MAKIEHIKNKRGEVIYPVSKEGAIYDENGVLLSTKIATFITRLVDNLANYYLKSETYTKGEVDELIGAIQGFTYIVVSALPTASAETMGIVYLVPSEDPQTQNVKDEYITIRSGVEGSYTYSWEQIGSTAIDLSGYVTTEALNTALADYTTTANLTTLLAAKQDTIADLSTIRSGAAAGATAYQKPGTGIPATDMASGVQTSLGKADSAYQKPSGGIPKTDLESGVQGSLELADTAVQADPIGSIVPPVDPSEFATKEEVEGLEAKVDEKVQEKVIVGVNKFDKTSNNLFNGYGGATQYISNNSYRMTHPIAVEAGKTYKWPTIAALGTSQKGAYCNMDGDFISSFNVTTADGFCTWTAPSDGLVRVNIGTTSYVDSFMFCEDSVYPESYVPYSKTFFIGDEYHLGEGERAEVEQMIEPLSEDVAELQGVSDAFDNVKGTNIFNKNDTKIKHGYYSSSGSYTSSSSYFVTGPIPVKGGVSYKAPHPSSMGAENTTVAIVDTNNDKTGIINGVISGDYITFTPSSDCLVSLNGGANSLMDTFMVCVASEYPDEYIPYIAPYTILKDDYTPNKLTGKSVIFTGDSICAAPNDSANGGGWAKRIGEKNHMLWQNKAVSGGTIINKDLVDSSFTICDTDFGGGADYIILEGGTNDADRIGSILNDNTPQYYGSWNETDYVTVFANSTFCDAVQRLIQRVVTSFPMAKVGFIIAPKMGVTSNGYTKETSNRRAYFETIIKICHKWGVPVLNLWDECTMNPRLSAHYTAENHGPLYYDGQHPTAQGYEVMTPIIEAWMKTL